MHSLIGNSTSAKFIFFALDDVTSSVDEKKIKNLFDAKRINVYQRHGHYSSQLGPINDFFFLKRRGIFESKSYSDRGFTHVVRLDQNCELNVTIELAFSDTVMGCLDLNDDLLESLNTILDELSKLKSHIDNVDTGKNRFLSSLNDIRELKYMRNQFLIPKDQVVIDIFKNYALAEKQSIQQRFDEWDQLAQWRVNPIASNDDLSDAA